MGGRLASTRSGLTTAPPCAEVSVYGTAEPPPPPGQPPALPHSSHQAASSSNSSWPAAQFFLGVLVSTALVLLILAAGRHVSRHWRRARAGRGRTGDKDASELQPMHTVVVATEVETVPLARPVATEVETVPLAHQDSAGAASGAVAAPSWLVTTHSQHSA